MGTDDNGGPEASGARGPEGLSGAAESRRAKVRVPDLARRKVAGGSAPIVMLTAYDTPSAQMADAAKVDVILVGDSVAMAVLGHPTTLAVGVGDLAHHVAAVARAEPKALVVADLPWPAAQLGPNAALEAAVELVRAGAEAVKVEGGRRRLGAISALLDADIPVMGHLGLTPQALHALGGYRVQGRSADAVRCLLDDAVALDEAGIFALVLEAVPEPVARAVTEAVAVPTIGIGAGARTDGQVLVLHDLLGLGRPGGPSPRFVRRYAELGEAGRSAIARWREDVRSGAFPSEQETYPLDPEVRRELAAEGLIPG